MLATLKDGEANLTTFEYDGYDRLSKTRYPLPAKGSNASSTTDYEQLTYDPNSNVTARRLRDGQYLTWVYDALNRVTYKNLPGTATDVLPTYDNLGRVVSARFANNSQTITNSYDALSRLITTSSDVGGTARTLTNAYDLAGQRTRLTWPDGFYVDYDYLLTGDLSKIRENGATTGAGVLATFGYDDLGNRASLTRGNGTSTGYGYDPVSRLTSLSLDLSGTANDLTRTFAYNPASQIVTRTTSNDAYAFTGLTNGTTSTTTNGLNELATVGAVTATSDARGNLTYAGTGTLAYDAENKLTSVATGGVAANAIYDPLDRLTQMWGTAVSDFTFLTDPGSGDSVVAQYGSGSGALQARHVFAGLNEPIVSYDAAGIRTWLAADERGSIIAAVDASGAASAIYSYDEYGVPGAANGGRFGYTGQVRLPELVESGLYYYKNRMYSAELGGRFNQTDPIGLAGGVNPYAYVFNDPVNFVDPLGLDRTINIKYPGPECVIVTGVRIPQPDLGDQTLLASQQVNIANLLAIAASKSKSDANDTQKPKPCPQLLKMTDALGEQLQQDALILGGVSTLVTVIAPESGAEVGIGAAVYLYGLGTVYRSSASLAEAVLGYGNGSVAELSEVNDLAMGIAGVPDSLKPTLAQAVESAESNIGFDAGNSTCR
jgi:RHS repeat-associated protein